MAYDRGAILVCCFTRGNEGNPVSLAPDRTRLILDARDRANVALNEPYVCAVKAVGPKGDRGPRSYIVKLDRPLAPRVYTRLVHADFEHARLRVAFDHPTFFRGLQEQTVDAEVHEELRGDHILLRLSYGGVSAEVELDADEAIKRGLRFNALAPDNHGRPGIGARIHHPNPRVSEGPGLSDTIGFLFRHTAQLAPAIPLVLERIDGDDLLALARKRITQILANRAYDPVSPDSKDEAALEIALTALARLALLTHGDPRARRCLALAEKRLVQRRVQRLGADDVARLLRLLGLDASAVQAYVVLPLRDYLVATRARTHARWALPNQHVQGGRVHVKSARARLLLSDLAELALRADQGAPPVNEPDLVHLREHATRVLSAWDVGDVVAVHNPAALQAYPPCVTHALHRALEGELSEAEAFNAVAFLIRIGVNPAAASNAIHGLEAGGRRYVTPNASGRAHAKWLRPPTCDLNRELGVCKWTCNTRSPLEYHAQRATPTPPAPPVPASYPSRQVDA